MKGDKQCTVHTHTHTHTRTRDSCLSDPALSHLAVAVRTATAIYTSYTRITYKDPVRIAQ